MVSTYFLVDTMEPLLLPETNRQRRRYSRHFKADIVAACLQPGVSITAMAMANGINPNLLRRWIRCQADSVVARRTEDAILMPVTPALVPVCVSDPIRQPVPASAESIRLELRRGDIALNVTWPATQAESCAHWLRVLWS